MSTRGAWFSPLQLAAKTRVDPEEGTEAVPGGHDSNPAKDRVGEKKSIPTAITFLGFWKKESGALARPFVIFGRVPLFYYLLHLFVLHSMAIVYSWFTFGSARWLFEIPATVDSNFGSVPKDYGVGLRLVYVFGLSRC